ncbi:MAG TPA: pyridoxamine 5'-phosphate oxidase family protein [Mycobacterium sp.]|nr:pyridoxamine 5'-phosphate oxidase family protein [Mycobacterium sp.]
MDTVGFHEGELAVQRRAGVERLAARLVGMLDPPMLDGGMRQFLNDRHMIMVTSRDGAGRLWISPVFGPLGFLDAHDSTFRVLARPEVGDPLAQLQPGQPMAVIAVDFAIRRRLRINGILTASSTDSFQISVDQAYGNCPQYIQQRQVQQESSSASNTRRQSHSCRSVTLVPEDTRLIQGADTFILGTTHPTRGTDASHRGGAPGFVRVEGNEPWWPDYPGNNLFNSLGNIAVDPTAAMLFFDFTAGDTLQLSGDAAIEWVGLGSPGDDGGTGRRVRFTPRHIVSRRGLSFRATAVKPYPRNPALSA